MSGTAPPQVSILLPTHNRADVLPFAIQSALAQTFADFELLVVGDGCTDETASVVQGVGDARIQWHDFPKAPGFGYANRNRGLRQARGEIIAYLAHDDLWFPDHLAQMLACLRENEAELAYSLPLDVSPTGYITPSVFNLHDDVTWEQLRRQRWGLASISAIIHRRACLEQYGYWSESMAHGGDWELWKRILRRAPRHNFAYWPTPTALHFVADWRRYRETWSRRWWRRMREREGIAYPAFKLELEAGESEQAAAWRAMSPAPGTWAREVRRAAQMDLDRRGAYRLTLTDALEMARRSVRRARLPRPSPPDDKV